MSAENQKIPAFCHLEKKMYFCKKNTICDYFNIKFMKTYKIISGICALLVITGAVVQLFHVNIGMPEKTVTFFVILSWALYQSWYISRLHKQLRNKVEK